MCDVWCRGSPNPTTIDQASLRTRMVFKGSAFHRSREFRDSQFLKPAGSGTLGISHKAATNSSTLVAEEYAKIRVSLKKKGRPIPENDIWIAAICVVNEVPIATRDAHLGAIEELEIVELQKQA